MRFFKSKWYIGENRLPGRKPYYTIFQGRPYSKLDFEKIEEFTSVSQALALHRHWRRASRVVFEPLEKLIIENIPREKLISD